MYDENKDCIGEVNLAGISAVESSTEARCARGCGVDVTAHVNKGGDSNGMRTFVLEARTPELARQWMDEICKASGKFVLKGSPQGGFHSERIDDRSAAKHAWLLTGTQTGAGTTTTTTTAGSGEGAEGGATEGAAFGAPGAERRRSLILDGRGGRGGGRGRGEAFAAGSSRRASVKLGDAAGAVAGAGAGSGPGGADYGAPIDFGPEANRADVLSTRRGSRRMSGRGFERRTSANNIPIAPGNI